MSLRVKTCPWCGRVPSVGLRMHTTGAGVAVAHLVATPCTCGLAQYAIARRRERRAMAHHVATNAAVLAAALTPVFGVLLNDVALGVICLVLWLCAMVARAWFAPRRSEAPQQPTHSPRRPLPPPAFRLGDTRDPLSVATPPDQRA